MPKPQLTRRTAAGSRDRVTSAEQAAGTVRGPGESQRERACPANASGGPDLRGGLSGAGRERAAAGVSHPLTIILDNPN